MSAFAREIGLREELTNDEYIERAMAIVARDELSMLPSVFVSAERYRTALESDAGTLFVVELLRLLIDVLETRDVEAVLPAVRACPAWLAEHAGEVLEQAFASDMRPENAEDLGDAVVLCAALLMGIAGNVDRARDLLELTGPSRDAQLFQTPARAILSRFTIDQPKRFQCKLVIWDLDDTLWAGTLDNGDLPRLHDHRAALIDALNEHGVVNAICSKNDYAVAQTMLERLGLWDSFVFRRIAFVPKGAVIRQMIADMQLRAANVLFVDDNPHNLHEVAAAVPGIRNVDATSPDCDVLLAEILHDVADRRKSRVDEYRLLEARLEERTASPLNDEEFLLSSKIEAAFIERMEALELSARMEELINRSNQLNYTGTRVSSGDIHRRILDIDNYVVLGVFVWDKYGYYGLVGVAVYEFRVRKLEHLALSCRIMHMGVEDAIIERFKQLGFQLNPAAVVKPLPAQSSRAITIRSFADPAIRELVLAREAPRDWSRVRLRIMADCQSAPLHHYSQHRDEADFDNMPRYFCLPKVADNEHLSQKFPPALVYSAAVDYIDLRWDKLGGKIDVALFRDYLHTFVDLVIAGGHQLLVMLPPEDRSVDDYVLFFECDARRHKALHPRLNAEWRMAAARAPEQITVMELSDVLRDGDYVHAHHYVPSALRHISGLMDDWYRRTVKPNISVPELSLV